MPLFIVVIPIYYSVKTAKTRNKSSGLSMQCPLSNTSIATSRIKRRLPTDDSRSPKLGIQTIEKSFNMFGIDLMRQNNKARATANSDAAYAF